MVTELLVKSTLNIWIQETRCLKVYIQNTFPTSPNFCVLDNLASNYRNLPFCDLLRYKLQTDPEEEHLPHWYLPQEITSLHMLKVLYNHWCRPGSCGVVSIVKSRSYTVNGFTELRLNSNYQEELQLNWSHKIILRHSVLAVNSILKLGLIKLAQIYKFLK